MSTVSLAYHQSSAAEIEQVLPHLNRLGWTIDHSVCNGPGAIPLGQKLLQTAGPMLLFVNDELLHSLNCQRNLLEAYKQRRDSNDLHVILASSNRQGPGGVSARVLTSLARVSDVIRYMNFWQNAYLTRRRDLSPQTNPEHEEELAIIRKVSQEIGETLRLIREDGTVSVYELIADNGKILEQTLGHGPKSLQTGNSAQEVNSGADLTSNATQSPTSQAALPTQDSAATTSNLSAQSDLSKDEPMTSAAVPDQIISRPTPESLGENTNADDQGSNEVFETSEADEVTDVGKASAEQQINVRPEATHEGDPIQSIETEEPSLAELAAKAQKKYRKHNTKKLVKLISQGEHAEALEFAGRLLADDPDNHKVRYILAVALLDEGSQSAQREAVLHLEQLLDGKYAPHASLVLGKISLRERDYGSARRHFLLADHLNPSLDTELSYQLGALLQDEFPEYSKEAKRFLKKATKTSQDSKADAWYRLGQLYSKKGKWKKAVRSFKTALSFDQKHPFAAYDLASTYVKHERPTKAANFFRKAVEANPELNTAENIAAFTPPNVEIEKAAFAKYLRSQPGSGEDVAADAFALDDLLQANIGRSAKSIPSRLSSPRETLTVLITGATSGIGKATAIEFARGGHRLILTGRRVEKLRELSQHLFKNHQSSVRLLSYDVREIEEAEHALATLPEEWQKIDVLINNAGKAKGLDFIHEGQLDHWEEMIDTNVKGLLYATRIVSPGMVARGEGHIINVCSTAGHEVYPRGAVYCATKHAVDAITQGTRLDLHRFGIRVSQVSPAHVEETEFASVRFDGDQDRAAEVYKDFQPLRASDVARSIYYIATEPDHVNIQDVLMLGTQQANSTTIDRSGR